MRRFGLLGLFAAVGVLVFLLATSRHGGQSLDQILATDPACAPRHWKYIIIHHSASASGSAAIFDEWHRAKGWRSLGYDFVIGNGHEQGDGVIEAGPRWYKQEAGAHANSAEHNDYGIGICLVGNFEERAPTPAQWQALCALAKELCRRYGISRENILGHNQVRHGGGTACPGRYFSMPALRDAVR